MTSATDLQHTPSLMADIASGFLVFLIALPLCLGISIASGFPPVAGIITAIVGGVFSSFLGSAALTIKGPAAGLIVIALGAVQELGMGDPVTGYRRALAVGVIAALMQILFSCSGVAILGFALSPSVLHGMLAAIGVIIIAKQAHVLTGVSPDGRSALDLLFEIPESLLLANPVILLIGIVSLCILFGHSLLKNRFVKKIPAPLLVLVFAVPMGMYFDIGRSHSYSLFGSIHSVGPEYLIQLPGAISDAIVYPDFSVVWTVPSIKYILLFALIGSIESVLSVIAVDAMDPRKQVSNVNKDLFSVGAGNLVAALLGGLPMISEIVRSKANIDSGATSKNANVAHGIFLLIFVAVFPVLLSNIPLSALAAMLVYTGFRLTAPAQYSHAKATGYDQLFLFLTTFMVTLCVDLLLGVVVGILLELVFHLIRGAKLKSLFVPSIEKRIDNHELYINIRDCAVFTNYLQIRRVVLNTEGTVSGVHLNLSRARLVDHTFLTRMSELSEELHDMTFEVLGLESLVAASAHPLATRRRRM